MNLLWFRKYPKTNYNDYSKEEMTLISDEFILQNHEPIRKVAMYCQNLNQKIMGLNYYGLGPAEC